jgi:hypothetical protein
LWNFNEAHVRNRWSDLSVLEIKVILGLIINMGLTELPDIKDYWSSEWTTQIQYFGNIISFYRYFE